MKRSAPENLSRPRWDRRMGGWDVGSLTLCFFASADGSRARPSLHHIPAGGLFVALNDPWTLTIWGLPTVPRRASKLKEPTTRVADEDWMVRVPSVDVYEEEPKSATKEAKKTVLVAPMAWTDRLMG